MANQVDTIEEVASEIRSKLSSKSKKNKILLLYAFNGTGKTRLSTSLQSTLDPEEDEFDKLEVLSYNSFFEDWFTWDNDDYILKFNSNNSIITFIVDQGLENQITDNFQILTRSKIFPSYNFNLGQITFNFLPGDDRSEENIKISRGEESIFIWSVFYTVLEAAISNLNSEQDDRETELFNDLEYIVIDDPVSSIDDTKIITMAIELVKLINSLENNNIKILITTHHALFFNILCNEYAKNRKFKAEKLLLSKNLSGYTLDKQGDTPFAYHVAIKDEIQKAIDEEDLKKYHFNLFRGLLEKTANFLGYKNWSDCIEGEEKKEIMRLVNLYSHGKLSDLESNHFPDEHKDMFKEVFRKFIDRFNWQSNESIITNTSNK